MQQFFTKETIKIGESIGLDKDTEYQLRKVLRANDGYLMRLADINGHIFLCEYRAGKALVKEELEEYNENSVYVTAIVALIKNDKMDLMIQKLTELGVNRIVPFKAYRSVVREGKGKNKLERFRKIAKEAAEQCHRNRIPEICDHASLADLERYKSDLNIVAYEKEEKGRLSLNDCRSISFIIGPEGGFEPSEIEEIIGMGFYPISLGKRILRAETASIYLMSIISEAEV